MTVLRQWDGTSWNAIGSYSDLLASKADPLIGSSILIYSHSYGVGGGTTVPLAQWASLLSGELSSELRDKAVAGAQAAHDEEWMLGTTGKGGWAWVLQSIYPSASLAPDNPAGYLPVVMIGLNDANSHSHDATGAPRTIFKTALRTILSRICATRVYEVGSSAIVLTGTTWQQAVLCNTRNSGRSHQPVPGTSGVYTFTIPADFNPPAGGGYISVGFTVWPSGDGTVTWSGTAFTGGGGSVTNPGVTSMAGLAYAANGLTGTAQRDSSNGHVVRFLCQASDAGRTIVGTIGGTTATRSTPSAPGALTVTGTNNGVTYTYSRVYRYYNGDTVKSATVTTAVGPTTLNGTNFVTIPAGAAFPAGVEAELIFREVGGASQGLICTLTRANGPAAVADKGASNTGTGYNSPKATASAYTANTANPLSGGFSLDYVQIEANDPPYSGIVCNIARVLAAGYAFSTGDADVGNYNADIASVVAEFPGSWPIADIDGTLNKTTSLYNSDGLHPNNLGHRAIAGTIVNAVSALGLTLSANSVLSHSRTRKSVASRVVRNLYYDPPYVTPLGPISTFPNVAAGVCDYVLPNTYPLPFLDTTNLSIQISAEIGDDIDVEIAGFFSSTNTYAMLDVAICDTSGNAIRWISSQLAAGDNFGHKPWFVNGNSLSQGFHGSGMFVVQPGDLYVAQGGTNLLWLKVAGGSGASRTLFGGSTPGSPLKFIVTNKSQHNAAFNTS